MQTFKRIFLLVLATVAILVVSGCFAGSKVTVAINSSPDGADIYYPYSESSEGNKIGVTPLKLPETDFKDNKFLGTYLFKKEGFKSEKKRLEKPAVTPPNKQLSFVVELQPITSISQTISSLPSGATIYFDEDNSGKFLKLGTASPKLIETKNDEKSELPPSWPKGVFKAELTGYKTKLVPVSQTSSNREVSIELEPVPKMPVPPRVTYTEPKSAPAQSNVDVFPPANIATSSPIAVLAFSDKSKTDASTSAADKLIYKLQRKGYFVIEREITEKAKNSILALHPERKNGPDVDLARDLAEPLKCMYVLFGAINEFSEELDNLNIQPVISDSEKQRYKKEYDEYVEYHESERLPLSQKVRTLNDIEQELVLNVKPKRVKVAKVNISVKLVDTTNGRTVWKGIVSVADNDLNSALDKTITAIADNIVNK